MRTLKVQMNLSLGDKWDDEMTNFSIDNLKNVDTILLGRKTAEGFIPYWEDVAKNPQDGYHNLGKTINDIPKAVCSNSLTNSPWNNTTIVNGDLSNLQEKAVLVYGGESFVAYLMEQGLIDELYLLVNPAAIGNGQPGFNPLKNNVQLALKQCSPFPSGIVLLTYTRTA